MAQYQRIEEDVRAVLHNDEQPLAIDNRRIDVPRDVVIDIVARSFHAYEYAMGFGDHFRVLVAVGGVSSIDHGVPAAGVCFATVFYSPDRDVITIDFSLALP